MGYNPSFIELRETGYAKLNSIPLSFVSIVVGSISIALACTWPKHPAKYLFIIFVSVGFILRPAMATTIELSYAYFSGSPSSFHWLWIYHFLIQGINWLSMLLFLAFSVSTRNMFRALERNNNPQNLKPLEKGPAWNTTADKMQLKAISSKRNLAYVIDCLPLMATVIGSFYLTWAIAENKISGELRVLASLAFTCFGIFAPIYLLFKDSIKGQSIGKKLLGCRVVLSATGKPIGPAESLIRNLPFILPLAPLIELIVSKVNPDGQRLGDMLAETTVVAGGPDRIDGLPVAQVIGTEKKHALDD